MKRPKLLYLGFAFPPGVAARFPERQPAGHLIETCLVESLRPRFEVRSVGIASFDVRPFTSQGSSVGLPHVLNLLDGPPEVYHRQASLHRLKHQWREWTSAGWKPDAVMICNMSPVYNGFARWLSRQPSPPPLVLYLADSVSLQRRMKWWKRLRYRFKPMAYPDSEMVRHFNACVAVSRSTREFFEARRTPWLWLPNGCDPGRALCPAERVSDEPVSFGYFGTLSGYGGLPALLRLFSDGGLPNPLHICGFGKGKEGVELVCSKHPRARLYPPRSPDECLRFSEICDVMVNPRPLWPGNENNFSSKVFEYALTGRSILSSRLSGVDAVLGEEAYYFDAGDFERSLGAAVREIAGTRRSELHRRGAAIQARMLREYSWSRQGGRLADFLEGVAGGGGGGRPLEPAQG